MALYAPAVSRSGLEERSSLLHLGDIALQGVSGGSQSHKPDLGLLAFLSRINSGQVHENSRLAALQAFVDDSVNHIDRLMALPDAHYQSRAGNKSVRVAVDVMRDLYGFYKAELERWFEFFYFTKPYEFDHSPQSWDEWSAFRDVLRGLYHARRDVSEGLQRKLHRVEATAIFTYTQQYFF